jgi:hypothetical protein
VWSVVLVLLLAISWWTVASDDSEGSHAPSVVRQPRETAQPGGPAGRSFAGDKPGLESSALERSVFERSGAEKSAEQRRREELAREIVRRRGAHVFGDGRLQRHPAGSASTATSGAASSNAAAASSP